CHGLEEKHQVFSAADEELRAAKQKLMMLDSAAEERVKDPLVKDLHRIHKENGWAYTTCKECNKKVNVVESKAMSPAGKSKVTFYCEDHGAIHVASRYKVIMQIIDQSGSAPIVFFNTTINKLSGYTAWELMKKHNMDVDEYWPGELLDLIGNSFLFKLYYSDYIINNNNHTYRCDAVNDEPAFVKHFKEGFLDDEDDNEGFTTPASQIKVTNLGDHSLNRVLSMQTPNNGNEALGSGESSASKRVFIDLDDIDSEEDEEGRANKTPKLLTVCNDYGTVVDVFIPNKKFKAGKRFAFVRFIKYHGGSNVTISTPPFLLKPTLVLDDSCLVNRDLVNCVMGEVLQFSSINNLQNNDEDVAFDGKEHDFDAKKPESKVNVSPSSSAQSRKQDDKTMKKAKIKSPVESSTVYRHVSAEFKDCYENSSNEVNVAGTIVPTVGQNSLNNTNPFSAAGPLNTIASPTHGKSSFKDASQLFDDLDMLELEDITYSDDENDVGAEADFNNLETSITVSHIPTTRIHKDHPEEPKRVHQALKDPSCIETMHEELLQFKIGKIDQTLFIKKQKGDILLVQIYVDDIIFGATNKDLCKSFEKLMKDKFQMSFMGELTFFLGLQIKQKKDGIFIGQDKYVAKILRKFGLTEGKSASTPIDTEKPLLKHSNGEDVDVHAYRSMIGSLMYLTSSKLEIMFSFWNTVTIKQDNDVTRMQALVDKKKVVVTEAAIKDVLRLDDVEGVDCLPNEELFAELARMGYEKPSAKLIFYKAFFLSQWKFLIHTILQSMSTKRTSWNEFSSAMVSTVICLSTGDLSNHTTKYASPALTQKDKRLRKEEMQKSMFKMLLLVMLLKEMILLLMEKFLLSLKNHPYHLLLYLLHHHNHLKISHQHPRRVEHLEYDKVAQALKITKLKRRVKKLDKGNRVKVLKLRRLKRIGTSQRIDTSDDTVMDDASNQERITNEMDKDDVVALMDDKEDDKKDEEAKVDENDQEDEPAKVQEVVDVVTTAKLITEVVTAASETVTTSRVVIRDLEEESTTSLIIPVDTKSKDKGKGVMVEEPKPLKKNYQIEMDEEYARKLHAELNKDIDWDVAINHVKLKAKEDLATKEQMEEEKSRALQRINETPTERATKRRKLDEEVEDLKRHLEIVADEDDNVYTEATPLARKVLVVDYEIIEINNKPYYKIIRADRTHQLYISFLTLLKNFEREDLEALWNLVKERFSTSKPKNFSDDFLLTTLGAMFEKPDAQAQLILLVERRYPLSRFTLDQMLNAVRLRVEEESEMSLELLSFGVDVAMDLKKNTKCLVLLELPFHKKVLRSETLLSFSSKNEEKVFNPGILTSKGVHTSLLLELSHRGPEAFKVIKIFESLMEIFPCSYGEDIRILDVPCLYFYPPLAKHQPQKNPHREPSYTRGKEGNHLI
nr:hypothetical protein [Tanacetum cinerariifolium]